MLAIQKQPQYLKKKVRLPNGSLALVVFELQGNTWKAVYGEILEAKISQSEILALPAHFESQHILPVISPYFSHLEIFVRNLFFVFAQPVRGPDLL